MESSAGGSAAGQPAAERSDGSEPRESGEPESSEPESSEPECTEVECTEPERSDPAEIAVDTPATRADESGSAGVAESASAADATAADMPAVTETPVAEPAVAETAIADTGLAEPANAEGVSAEARAAEPADDQAVHEPGRRELRQARRKERLHKYRWVWRPGLAVVAAFAILVGYSLSNALTVPGGGTFSQRVAEWARDNNMGFLVTFGEWLTYQPPKRGGKPDVSFNKLGGHVVAKCPAHSSHARKRVPKACQKKQDHGIRPIIPANLGSPAGKPLPGEGVWKAIVSVKGVPAVFKTYVRESRTYSSYYAGIVSMDPRLLRFELRPGTEDPGYGNWGAAMDIPPGHRQGLVATFNSGFRIATSDGGWYLNGHYDGQLVKGVASEVYYRDGAMKIGVWGRGSLHMGPQVVGVRQNLHLIVINGQVPSTVNQNVEAAWGATLSSNYYVWRSGVGMTKDGRIIFVYGPAMDVRTLAELLKRAGCVTAMELDINPDWMSFMYYLAKNHPANPTPVNLLRGQIQPPDRYYYLANRDFTAVFSR